MMPTRLLTPLLLLCALLGGCSSPWEQHYRAVRQLAGVDLSERETARVIEVEWERLAAYERAARERAISRDDRPDQLATETAQSELEALLDATRVDAAPSGTLVLGSSRFLSTTLLNPYDESVRALAARLGGDIAVVSIEPLGLRETVEYATRTEWYERDVYDSRGRRRGDRIERRVEESIPVVVPRETWGYTLIVLRLEDEQTVRALTGGRPWLP